MKIDKSVVIPNFTEIEVEIETDEILEEMDADDILEHLVSSVGCGLIFRKMQMQHDFEQADIEEAFGEKFGNDKLLTYDDIQDAIENGNFAMENILKMVDDEDIIEYYRTKIKSDVTLQIDEVTKYLRTDASPVNKLRAMKALMEGITDE